MRAAGSRSANARTEARLARSSASRQKRAPGTSALIRSTVDCPWYFGAKKELFREAMGHDMGLSGFFAAGRKDFGRHVVHPRAESRAALMLALFCGVWVFRSTLPLNPFTGNLDAATDAKLAAMLQDLVERRSEAEVVTEQLGRASASQQDR